MENSGLSSRPTLLFASSTDGATTGESPSPACLVDLGLDQVFTAVVQGREDYGLAALYHDPVATPDDIAYHRHEVMRELDGTEWTKCVQVFAREMATMRRNLAQSTTLHYVRQRQSWFLDAADVYVQAVARLSDQFSAMQPTSRAFAGSSRWMVSVGVSLPAE
jgi:hypothetical protein